mgnify:CR=1 FL=1
MRYNVEGDELSNMTHGFKNICQTGQDKLSDESEEEFADYMYDHALDMLEQCSGLPDDDNVI